MSNVGKLKFIENEDFLSLFKNLLHTKFFSASTTKVVKILEVGCGPGDFALILKDALKDQVKIKAIDPSDDIEAAKAKSNGNDVSFERGDIFNFSTEEKFDVVLFTKSLHHCHPIEKALQNASNLLNEDGVFVAEEIYTDPATFEHVDWFFDRLDLLRAGGHLIPLQERLENAGHTKKMLSKFLNVNLSNSERWFRPIKENMGKFHRDDPEGITPATELFKQIEQHFGKENVEYIKAAQLYHFVVFAGLTDNETNQEVLKEFIKQENRAIQQSGLPPLGIYIICHK
ncbi:hypothetical protein CU098_008727 [Rhizopus stolonifer]|uniref:Methyltransferase domain-containing protein n=1 Tax=Rhizopus stolonifer TaxID=4846 RepID=A0A367J7X2_RHIST|nr:hypothetical protein CU098_008727 [Rhizopus stolonifer]